MLALCAELVSYITNNGIENSQAMLYQITAANVKIAMKQ